MKLFLSWSGSTSHALADVLRSWLPGVLPAVQPWLASEDIPKGAQWSTVIADALKTADFGVICIVSDNLDARWLNYEAGALANASVRSKVAPVLFGVPPSRVTGPLAQFQMTVFEHSDFLNLLRTINGELGDRALGNATLVRLFAGAWPRLAQSVEALLAPPESRGADGWDEEEPEAYEPNSDDDEVLELLANLPEREGRDWVEVDDIVDFLRLKTRRAEYILHFLTQHCFLDEGEDDDGNPVWSLSNLGLQYVVEAELLDE